MIAAERHVVNETRSYRYPGSDADHAIVIHTGVASDGASQQSFCIHHASRGMDVWSVEVGPERAPDSGVDGLITVGEHVAHNTGLPLFVIGACIRQAQRAGDIDPGADARRHGRLLLAVLRGIEALGKANTSRASLRSIAEAALDTLPRP
jgi:hypothetical protein